MFSISGTKKTLCDGLTRRDFMQVGGIGAFGLSLAGTANLSAATLGSAFGKAKSCILLFPYGSPSSHETFDPKPEMPDVQGEMKAMATNVPGLHICDRLPQIAKVMDKVTVVRSMTHPYPVHGLAYAVTGLPTYTPALETRARDKQHWPFIGSVVDYLERRHGNAPADSIPNNIGLPWLVNSQTDNPAVNAGPFAAFLGAEYDPLWTDFDGKGLHVAPKNTVAQTKRFRNPFGGTTPNGRFRLSPAAELPGDISLERLRLRQSLLAQFDRQREQLDRNPDVHSWNRQQQLAMSLLTSNKLRDAMDIGREPRRLREQYGMNLFGQGCLAARRLIEAGGKFVSVFWDCYGQFANGSWDTHQYHYPRMKELLLPGFDLAYPTLLNDLEQRGLLDETLVIWMSEHGRTPKINSKPGAGREHWSRAYCVALAGGGIARGKVVGQTTRDGGEVLDNPVSPKDILATAFYLLGIDPSTTVPDQEGRPHSIAGSGELRPELIG
ncbi:MAG TPA: DUF1501 domain-containing protein [Planctomycetaceae bacterium]|nr:hypothetical protein [Blastopirellula sp.]HAY78291.1 DUF1501 domain-containing protein [Planctomycetaceae bacterium]